MEQVSVLFRPRLSSTCDYGIQPLYHPLPLITVIPNPEEMAEVLVLSVVEMEMELAELLVVSDVVEVEMVAEVVEAVVAANKFEMGIFPLLVCFPIEQLLLD